MVTMVQSLALLLGLVVSLSSTRGALSETVRRLQDDDQGGEPSGEKAGGAEESPGSWAVVGDLRVQCISPTLVRVEPKGPNGFEDRTTFNIVNRDYPGAPITSQTEEEGGTLVKTEFYSIMIGADGWSITTPMGDMLFDSGDNPWGASPNLLHWPPPLQHKAYAIVDSPRFFVPSWAVVPAGPDQGLDPALADTNGYDFGNDINGDTYVFLLGDTLEGWQKSREEFAKYFGPVPLLPDFAWGTWFTWWHPYTEEEAKADLFRWDNEKLPIDVWGLDMNWRHIHDDQDREYNHPNDTSFSDLGGFISYLRSKKLRTFFNDHPYPSAAQLSPEETGFRWNGLTQWMSQGVHFWWFDHNWKFSIPPPFVDGCDKDSNWKGLSTITWGSHVFWEIVNNYNQNQRNPNEDRYYGGRTITLSKFSEPDWEDYMDIGQSSQMPAQHRYPVWWTGDKVSLQASIESMVDSGIFNYKPYVHSDCGGDYFAQNGDLLRWTAHCTFGTIFRYHGCDHRPWTWGMHIEAVIRNYLNLRYRFLPSLVAAGQEATTTGFPLVARCDLFWPERAEEGANSNHQYVFLKDMLVSPIFNAESNWTTADVWIPEGDWQDAWDGSIATGPKRVDKTLPYEKIPLWYRRDGGLIVLASEPMLRTEDQDWATLILEAFPSQKAMTTSRTVYERSVETDAPPKTDLSMETDGEGGVAFDISEASDGTPRAWIIRINLLPNQQLSKVSVDGKTLDEFTHIYPSYARREARSGYFPMKGKGSPPAPYAGAIAEIEVPKSNGCKVEVTISKGSMDTADAEGPEEGPATLVEAKNSVIEVADRIPLSGPADKQPVWQLASVLCAVAGVTAVAGGGLRWHRRNAINTAVGGEQDGAPILMPPDSHPLMSHDAEVAPLA